MNVFLGARIKLAFWYVVAILLVSGTFSGVYYFRVSDVLDKEFLRIEDRLQMQYNRISPVGRRTLLYIQAEEIEQTKRRVASQLLVANGVIAALAAVLGYVLSGKTLRPIEESMNRQQRFISDAAHELRTPLTSLKTSMEVNLMDKKISNRAKGMLRENLEDLARLESLTEGLLRLSRLNRDNMIRKKVVVGEFVSHALKTVKPLAAKKNIKIKFKRKDGRLFVMGAKDSLIEMIVVFLDNAVKFSPKGNSINLEVGSNRRWVVIKIVDQGIGISKQDLPHIFDRFYQVDRSRSNADNNGHGLGLCIAKKIIEDHRGSVSVESKLGKGTKFTVKLPKV